MLRSIESTRKLLSERGFVTLRPVLSGSLAFVGGPPVTATADAGIEIALRLIDRPRVLEIRGREKPWRVAIPLPHRPSGDCAGAPIVNGVSIDPPSRALVVEVEQLFAADSCGELPPAWLVRVLPAG